MVPNVTVHLNLGVKLLVLLYNMHYCLFKNIYLSYNPLSVADPTLYTGLTIIFDNLNVSRKPHSCYSGRTTEQLNAIAAAAAINRIPQPASRLLNDHKVRASSLPFEAFVVCKEEVDMLRNSHLILIQRCLVTNISCLNHLKTEVVWHIPHLYSKESSNKSETINLGCFKANETETEGIILFQQSQILIY